VHGLVASAQKSAYVAAKHGVIGLTKVAALENATTGVTCNAICPGWVLTPLVQKQVDARAAKDGVDNEEAKRRLLAEKQPSLQFTTPEQLGELADRGISYAGITPTSVSTVQVSAVVLGHVLGVVLAHDRAVRLFPRRQALLGQLPLLALMVTYTVGGLLLLFAA